MLFCARENLIITSTTTGNETISLPGVDLTKRLVPRIREIELTLDPIDWPIGESPARVWFGISKETDTTPTIDHDETIQGWEMVVEGAVYCLATDFLRVFQDPIALAKEEVYLVFESSHACSINLYSRIFYEVTRVKSDEMVALMV